MSRSSEHSRSPKARPYRMGKRAAKVDETRQRIIEAAVDLHTTVGPEATTISALAQHAGVTRLTVYRHFSDIEELFFACQALWLREHPPPDPEKWLEVDAVEDRALRAIDELYDWYRRNSDDLYPIYRDFGAMPPSVQALLGSAWTAFGDALVRGVSVRGRAQRLLHAAARHVVSFGTWRSLAVDQRLPHHEAVDMAFQFLRAMLPKADRARRGV